MIQFLGVYDYTVILTYLSLFSSVFGIVQAVHGNFITAVFCLAFSGICDAFDGRVARTKKNRTEDEKNFGIQLDSLCDVICFGAFPALISYLLGVRGIIGFTIIFFYCLCAVIRLAFFNVLETKRQRTESGCAKTYHGLPVTSISFIYPVVFWFQYLLPDNIFLVVLQAVMVLVGFLFILDFQLRKPSLKVILHLIGIAAIIIGIIFAYTKFFAPQKSNSSNNTDIEETYETKAP